MLTDLHVKNLALIKEAEVSFGPGLNLFSGETGAGKSILLGGIELCLGKRADSSLIRTGAESALAELTFTADTDALSDALAAIGIFPEEGVYRLSRRIYPDRSVARINGETVPLKTLREAAVLFIDVYGQHEQNELRAEDHHEKILDAFPNDDLKAKKENYRTVYDRYRNAKALFDRIGQNEEERRRRIDYLEFAVSEIEDADLKADEEDALRMNLKKLRYHKHLTETLSAADEGLRESILPLLTDSLKSIRDLTALDPELERALSLFYDAEGILRDAEQELVLRMPDEIEPGTIETIEERLDRIQRLKDKYGPTVGDVLMKADVLKEELKTLRALTEKSEEIRLNFSDARHDLIRSANELSDARTKAARIFDEKMTESLQGLNFPKVVFRTEVEKTNRYTSHGADEVRFLFSANPGEPVKPVDRVASGGELSRIMLAMKTLSVSHEEVGRTMLFDEIDSGISGRTAKDVGEKLKRIAAGNQVIAISHLPQIVAKADRHFKIEKEFSDDETETKVRELTEEESIREIARLVGTGEITEAALQNAAELKKHEKGIVPQ